VHFHEHLPVQHPSDHRQQGDTQLFRVNISEYERYSEKYHEAISQSFSPLPLLYAPLCEKEILGIEMPERMSEGLFGETDPVALPYNGRIQQVEKIDGENRTPK